MAIGPVRSAVVDEIWIAIDRVEDVAEEQVGVVVVAGRSRGRAADEDRTLQGGEEGELPLLPGAHDGAKVGQIRMLIQESEELFERLAAVWFGECLEVEYLGHFWGPCGVCTECHVFVKGPRSVKKVGERLMQEARCGAAQGAVRKGFGRGQEFFAGCFGMD